MSDETFTDALMLEIFRAEVETHVEALTSGLLALERDPRDTSQIDEMMRGAHSIKGAARIVGIDPAVRVAHVMEDGFIAVQNGKLFFRPDHIDVLLRGVDILNRMAGATKNAAVNWTDFENEATPLVTEISAVLEGGISSSSHSTLSKVSPISVPSVSKLTVPKIAEITITIPVFLDAAAAETARCAFIDAVDSRATLIRVDLTLTQDLDATGLAFLAAVPAFLSKGNLRVELVGTSAEIRYVLDVTGVGRLYAAGGP